jgi:hypothetical protein
MLLFLVGRQHRAALIGKRLRFVASIIATTAIDSKRRRGASGHGGTHRFGDVRIEKLPGA